jgi:hypothetical protein
MLLVATLPPFRSSKPCVPDEGGGKGHPGAWARSQIPKGGGICVYLFARIGAGGLAGRSTYVLTPGAGLTSIRLGFRRP